MTPATPDLSHRAARTASRLAQVAAALTALCVSGASGQVLQRSAVLAASNDTKPLATVEGDGLRLKVWLQPTAASSPTTGTAPAALTQGQRARLRVEVRSATDDTLVAGIDPGAWLDRLDGDAPSDAACSRRIGGYVSNALTERAWRDLTGYHVLLLNGGEGGISVLDPKTNFAGKTSLRTTLPLPAPGFDWDLHPRHDRVYVSVPQTQQLAVVDLSSLDPSPLLVKLPGSPGRVRVHPSGEQVWVGVPAPQVRRTNTGVNPGEGGVAIVSTRDPQRHQWVATGNGHHEIAFDPDGLAAVTNRDSGSVAFVDPFTATTQRSAAIGGVPIATVFDARERSFVVADAKGGTLHRFDHTGAALGVPLPLEAGLGPMALSPDGRWLLALNPAANKLHVVDVLRWSRGRDVAVPGRPFQIVMTSQYAYLRSLDREDIVMVHWPSLGEGAEARVQRFVAGEKPPGAIPDLPLALQMSPLPDGSGIFAASPGDAAVYTYMQGMNAPMSSASPRGHPLRAVMVARQGLLEVARGVFEADVVLPAAPQAMLALATERPRTRHCVGVALAAAPLTAGSKVPTRLRWQIESQAGAGPPRINAVFDGDRASPWPQVITVWVFQPGEGKKALQARRQPAARDATDNHATGGGFAGNAVRVVYRTDAADLSPGAYYVHAQMGTEGIVSALMSRQYGSFVVDTKDQRP